MYQYKAMLKSNRTIIAEGHSVEDIEHAVLHFRRQQKKNAHTKMNEPVEVIHVKHNVEKNQHKEELIKII